MTFVDSLEPRPLWRHFDRILTIPRASKDEGRIREYVLGVAREHGLETREDSTGNVVVVKPGQNGGEDAPITILQSHLDMVQEKNSDVEFDWDADAIRPVRDGDYLTADGTTLGSDNGIGVAAMLAVLEDTETTHPPLELLFTMDEETGLTGAAGIGDHMLHGRRLINLDSEEEGSLCVGCAGGADSTLRLPVESAPTKDGSVALEVKLAGFKGGHSGVDIHLQRGNAIQLLARVLHTASLGHDLRVASFSGGSAHNAIPREAHAIIVVDGGAKDAVTGALDAEGASVAGEYRRPDPGAVLTVAATEPPARAWTRETSDRALQLLTGLPHGVVMMSNDIPGLVETSTNLATVQEDGGKLVVGMSSRSSVATALSALRRKIRATATLAGAEVSEGNGYPGWQPDLDSELLKVVRARHEEVLGSEPEVGAIHAGLECGIIGEKFSGMDMISVGPQIEFPHSPDERVHIDSVGRFHDLLTATLKELS